MVSPSATDTTFPWSIFDALALHTEKINKIDSKNFINEVCHIKCEFY